MAQQQSEGSRAANHGSEIRSASFIDASESCVKFVP